MYSQAFALASKFSDNDILSIYETKALSITALSQFMGVWHAHALEYVLEALLHVIYPCTGSVIYPVAGGVSGDLNRAIIPREKKYDIVVYIMWTHMTNTDPKSWWEPNHFVSLIFAPGDDKEETSMSPGECHSVKVDANEFTLTYSQKESTEAMDVQEDGSSARLDAAFG